MRAENKLPDAPEIGIVKEFLHLWAEFIMIVGVND